MGKMRIREIQSTLAKKQNTKASTLSPESSGKPQKGKTNLNWSGLEGLFGKISGGIVTYLEGIQDTHLMLTKHNKVDAHLNQLVMTTTRDCEAISIELEKIHAKHDTRKGVVDDADIATYFLLGDEYNGLFDKFICLAQQISLEIMDYTIDLSHEIAPESSIQTHLARIDQEVIALSTKSETPA